MATKEVKSIEVYRQGKYYPLIGNEIYLKGWVILKGGTEIYRDGTWYRYMEPLNADIRISITTGTAVSIAFKSLPSAPFRPAGIYHANKQIMTVQLKLTGQIAFTDDTSDAYIYTAGPFACDGQSHSVTDKISIPSGKTAYQITGIMAEVLYPDAGASSYKSGTITVTSEPMRFTAQAFTFPVGAGTATASPANPAYGQIVTFSAQDTVSGRTFVKWRESGKTQRSYSVKALGNIRDTAEFADTGKTIDFRIRIYTDSSRHICVDAKTLQNRSDQFVMVSFDIGYSDTSGMSQMLRYEREVYLSGQTESHTFGEMASEIGQVSTPEIFTLPYPYVLGNVEVQIGTDGPFMAESLKAGYSPWEVTADDDDAGPGDPG